MLAKASGKLKSNKPFAPPLQFQLLQSKYIEKGKQQYWLCFTLSKRLVMF